jgi:hypothetical protein
MLARLTVLCFFFLLRIPPICSAQPDTSSASAGDHGPSLGQIAVKDGLTVLGAMGFVFSGPLRWDGEDWAKLGGTIVLTAGAALLDDEVFSMMNRNRSRLNDGLEDVVVRYGDDLTILLLTGGIYATGFLTQESWLRETGLLIGTSALLAGAVSSLVKPLVGRARPYLGYGNHYFKPFKGTTNEFESFPSGHTIAAFSTSAVLARRIGNPWATVGLYTLAGATAFSRTYSRNHWLSDIVFGGIVTTLISNSIVTWYEGGMTSSRHF